MFLEFNIYNSFPSLKNFPKHDSCYDLLSIAFEFVCKDIDGLKYKEEDSVLFVFYACVDKYKGELNLTFEIVHEEDGSCFLTEFKTGKETKGNIKTLKVENNKEILKLKKVFSEKEFSSFEKFEDVYSFYVKEKVTPEFDKIYVFLSENNISFDKTSVMNELEDFCLSLTSSNPNSFFSKENNKELNVLLLNNYLNNQIKTIDKNKKVKL